MNDPIPMEMSDPMPAASSPGMRMVVSRGPPRPITSMRMIAAMSGDPKMSDSAANVAEAARI